MTNHDDCSAVIFSYLFDAHILQSVSRQRLIINVGKQSEQTIEKEENEEEGEKRKKTV